MKTEHRIIKWCYISVQELWLLALDKVGVSPGDFASKQTFVQWGVKLEKEQAAGSI
jgi:hypothetical protein